MMNISEKLKQARVASNLTQEVLAEKVGVSRQTISNWENGKSYPDIASIIILSDVYNMTLDSLLKGDSELIKHLKQSTDVTKSNRLLYASIIALVVLTVGYRVIIAFFDISQATNTVFNVMAITAFIFVAIVSAANQNVESIRKFLEQKTSNRTLARIGIITLYALFVFVPLIIFAPEAINTEFQIQADWVQRIVRVATASVLLILAFALNKIMR